MAIAPQSHIELLEYMDPAQNEYETGPVYDDIPVFTERLGVYA